MTRAQAREQKWLLRGVATLFVLALALVALVSYSVVQTSNDRAVTADRAVRTAAELHALAERLDEQAVALDRQATALDRQAQALKEQAESLEDRTARAEESREQFRQAAQEILEQLGSELDAFEPAGRAPQMSVPSTGQEPVEPAGEPTEAETTTPAPGCDRSGSKPPKCED